MIDQFGDGGVIDLYRDSWAYRVIQTGPDGGYVPAHWDFGGTDSLVGLTAAQIAAAVPFGTYAVPEPSALVLLSCAVLGLVRRRSRV